MIKPTNDADEDVSGDMWRVHLYLVLTKVNKDECTKGDGHCPYIGMNVEKEMDVVHTLDKRLSYVESIKIDWVCSNNQQALRRAICCDVPSIDLETSQKIKTKNRI